MSTTNYADKRIGTSNYALVQRITRINELVLLITRILVQVQRITRINELLKNHFRATGLNGLKSENNKINYLTIGGNFSYLY